MPFGKSADRGEHGSEAVLPGGGEVFQEIKRGEGVGGVGEDFFRRGAGKIITEEGDEAPDERTVGIAAEMTATVAELADEPDLGDTAGHTVGVGAQVGGQRRQATGAVDDGGEPLLWILDEEVVVDQGLTRN